MEVAMNAAQAVALPKGHPQDRARRGSAGPRPPLYLVPSPEAGDQAAGDQAADEQVPAPPVMTRQVRARTGVRGAPQAGSLRLTRRGRVVAAALAALLITGLSLIAAVSARATSHSAPQGKARQSLVQVVVRPGQSLWSVAESADPDADTRLVIQRIIDLNGLTGDAVQPGQQLWVPRS
jgi:nucleoid-associated protein YgaU